MQTDYVISVPAAFMYLEASEQSEVTDQVLYGTTITKLEKAEKGLVFCKTEYGYCGYLDTNVLSKKSLFPTKEYIVTSGFCGLYSLPEYRFSPSLLLPKGSIIRTESCSQKNDFLGFNLGNKHFFVHKCHVSPKEKLYAFHDDNQKRTQIVKTALSYLRTPYMWAGKSPYGIDCSGLCFMAYSMCGSGVYRDAEFDARYLRKIPKELLKKADLIYYNGHVVMYIGKGYYIHSYAGYGGVTINSFDKNNSLYLPKLDTSHICCASSLVFGEG